MLSAPSLNRFFKCIKTLGLPATLSLTFDYLSRQIPRRRSSLVMNLKPRGVLHSLSIRKSTSDRAVFEQVFLQREYDIELHDVPNLVIDCGANVGYTSAFFLSKYPSCKVISVEPDSNNYLQAKKNLSPYQERCNLIKAGIWCRSGWVEVIDKPYRDGRDWSRQVGQTSKSNPRAIPCIDLGTLLRESGSSRISILKMDIEGAEAVVFSENYRDWLSYTDTIMIELHDDSHFGNATDQFYSAIKDEGFTVFHQGELVIATR